MQFTTPIDIPPSAWKLMPCERMLFVGSCFAENMAKRCERDKMRVTANPYGTMYNPVSVLHTIERMDNSFDTVVITLGTNHVYILKQTGEIVDNCQKRPQNLFTERQLSVDECTEALATAIGMLRCQNPEVRVIVTVSPIRYRKYGFHGSQLSKATLLLAVNQLSNITYFPAYELFMDELRDYRFYAADMLHPSEQAVEYVWQRFSETFYGDEMQSFLARWRPIEAALNHRPFDAESQEYQNFIKQTNDKLALLKADYPNITE